MTDRHTVDTINSDQLDAPYYRLDQARSAAALHRQGLLSTTELHAVIEAGVEPGPAATEATEPASSPLRDQLAEAFARSDGWAWDPEHGSPSIESVLRYRRLARAAMAVILPATRITATLARMSEANVQHVITVTEAGPPSGTVVSGEWESGWDAAMDAVRNALTPPTDQTKEQ